MSERCQKDVSDVTRRTDGAEYVSRGVSEKDVSDVTQRIDGAEYRGMKIRSKIRNRGNDREWMRSLKYCTEIGTST